MKKVLAIALAAFFMTATSGLVLADTTTTTPKSGKHSHKGKHHKKPKGSAASSASAPSTAK